MALSIVGAYAGLSGLVLVLPFLLVFPLLRRPPYWLAVSWAVGIAFLFALYFMGPAVFSGAIGVPLVIASLGAGAGFTYAIAARVLMRFQRRV